MKVLATDTARMEQLVIEPNTLVFLCGRFWRRTPERSWESDIRFGGVACVTDYLHTPV